MRDTLRTVSPLSLIHFESFLRVIPLFAFIVTQLVSSIRHAKHI